MENSELISVFKTFSKKELLKFEKFLVSPYFGCKQFTVKLFSELNKYYPAFNGMDKKEIFKNSFPGKKYNDSLLRKSLSLLNQYVTQYMSQQLIESEPELADFMVINYTRTRNLFKLSRKHLNKFDNEQENAEIHLDYFYYLYLIEREKVFYKLAAFSQKDACREVVSRNETLVLDFIIKFSLGLYEMNANKSSFNYDYEHSISYRFYKNFDSEKFISEISLDDKFSYIYEISSYLLKLTFSSEAQAYFNLKQAVMKHHNKLHLSLTFGLFIILSSYSVLRFKKEHFEINKFLVENDFFLKIGAYFQLKDFIRTFRAAISADELQWAEKFLSDYTKYLNPEHQKNTQLYCNSMICYYKKDFAKALELLSKVKYQLFTYRQDINVMALQIHYELGNYEASLSLIDSYKHFLRENKFVNKSPRDRYNSFISFYMKLLNIELKKNPVPKEILLKEIKNERELAEREWLVEKLSTFKHQGFSTR